jgi:hypothetical protein
MLRIHSYRCVAPFLGMLLMWQSVAAISAQEIQGPRKLNLVIIEGEGAINNVRQRVAREPIVQVEDENRKPVAGAAVTFLLPQTGASGTFTNGSRVLMVTTDSKGQAVMRGMTPNDVSGALRINVSASYQGQTASTSITQTNAAGGGAASAASSGLNIAFKVIALAAVVGAAVVGGTVVANNQSEERHASPGPTIITPGTPAVR